MNLTKQVTIILAGFITIASVTVIVPAYLLIRRELTEQLNQRLAEATQHSQSILAFEQLQLESIVTLAAERPTLERLMREQDTDELRTYLQNFQGNTPLDQFYVTDLSGRFLAGSIREESAMALSFTVPVRDTGFITGEILLDTAFAERLQNQTGFRYEFHSTEGDANSLQDNLNGTIYYREVLPLQNLPNYPSATLVVMLPVTGLLASEKEIVGLLFSTTLIVALLTSMSGRLYIQSRIRPLWKLTAAALQMGHGDLSTPIAISSTTSEIRTLANVLELSRTRLRQTLKELSQAKEWSEALIQSVVEGIITLDRDGTVLFFSEGAAHITGIRRENALNANINSLFQTEGEEWLTDFIPPEGGRRTVVVRTPDNHHLTLAITRARQADQGQMTVVLHDITEETQRRNLQAYFLANVSHEFRTPLAGMKVSIELLLENARYLSVAELHELLNSLYLSISSLQNLIDNLLESSKIEANHFSLRRHPTLLNQVLSDALRLVQPFLNRRHQFLTLDQPLTLPTINVDATRLAQVFVNLLSNASKYSPMNSPIDISVDMKENTLYVTVADRGQGIPAEQRESIFRQFVRLNREAKSDHSTGLGLAVVKAIIETHGGQVGVNDRVGGGSIFWFTLPIQEAVVYESTDR